MKATANKHCHATIAGLQRGLGHASDAGLGNGIGSWGESGEQTILRVLIISVKGSTPELLHG